MATFPLHPHTVTDAITCPKKRWHNHNILLFNPRAVQFIKILRAIYVMDSWPMIQPCNNQILTLTTTISHIISRNASWSTWCQHAWWMTGCPIILIAPTSIFATFCGAPLPMRSQIRTIDKCTGNKSIFSKTLGQGVSTLSSVRMLRLQSEYVVDTDLLPNSSAAVEAALWFFLFLFFGEHESVLWWLRLNTFVSLMTTPLGTSFCLENPLVQVFLGASNSISIWTNGGKNIIGKQTDWG